MQQDNFTGKINLFFYGWSLWQWSILGKVTAKIRLPKSEVLSLQFDIMKDNYPEDIFFSRFFEAMCIVFHLQAVRQSRADIRTEKGVDLTLILSLGGWGVERKNSLLHAFEEAELQKDLLYYPVQYAINPDHVMFFLLLFFLVWLKTKKRSVCLCHTINWPLIYSIIPGLC